MDERLRTLQAEAEEEQALRRKRDSLEVEYRSLCSYERELAVLRQKELEDVARMEQGGVRNLFTKVTGKYEETLAQEQAEAAEVETKYQKVQQEIVQMEDALRQLDKRIGELSGSQARYDAYIIQRAEALEEAGTDSGIRDLQAQIRSLEERERALLEKRNRITDVRWEVRNVLGILEDAAGYRRWDAGRGSLFEAGADTESKRSHGRLTGSCQTCQRCGGQAAFGSSGSFAGSQKTARLGYFSG